MRSKIIHVTQQDIDEGHTVNAEDCAIARAIKRETGIERVTVGPYRLHYTPPNKKRSREMRLNAATANFIHEFDGTRASAKPFSFALVGYPADEEITK